MMWSPLPSYDHSIDTSQLDTDVFQLGVKLQAMHATFTTDARLFRTAKSRSQVT